MTRLLSAAERELWGRLRRSVRPLRTQHRPAEADAEPLPNDTPASGARQAPPSAPVSPPRQLGSPPGPVVLDDKRRRRLSRGLAEVDARIDLHGMRQERAFNALLSFLRHSQARGDRLVLVITGKGRDSVEGRGVLRVAVPVWLARSDLRDLVAGWEEAGRRHGGAGALFVMLRRRQAGSGRLPVPK